MEGQQRDVTLTPSRPAIRGAGARSNPGRPAGGPGSGHPPQPVVGPFPSSPAPTDSPLPPPLSQTTWPGGELLPGASTGPPDIQPAIQHKNLLAATLATSIRMNSCRPPQTPRQHNSPPNILATLLQNQIRSPPPPHSEPRKCAAPHLRSRRSRGPEPEG